MSGECKKGYKFLTKEKQEIRNKKIAESKTKTFEDFLKDYKNNNYTFFKEEYKNRGTKMKVLCNKHNIYFMISPRDLLRGRNCKLCGEENKKAKLRSNTEQFIEKAIKIHGDNYDYSLVNYIKKTDKVKIKCNFCGSVFEQRPDMHLRGSGCSCLNKSKGEERIKAYLDKGKINYKCQKTFSDLKDKNLLSYDFYLPDKNILIEYNGKQHYKSNSLFYRNKKNNFHLQLHHDWLKRRYARDNNIELLIISYIDFNKISEILEEKIK